MTSIDHPDWHAVREAAGWLELNNIEEADRCLGQVAPELQQHPLVASAVCIVALAREEWGRLIVASTWLTETEPGDRHAWIHRATALKELGRPLEALNVLEPAAVHFSEDPLIAEYVTTLLVALGREADADRWRNEAISREICRSIAQAIANCVGAVAKSDTKPPGSDAA